MATRKTKFILFFIFIDVLFICGVIWKYKDMGSGELVLSIAIIIIGGFAKLGVMFDRDEGNGSHGGYG